MRSLDQRYLDDPQFAMLVKHFEAMFTTAQFTPTEIREAAMLAQMRYEMNHPRLVTFSPDLRRELEFRMGMPLDRPGSITK